MIEFLKCYSNIVQYVDFFVNVFILNVVDAIEYIHQMHIYRMYIKYIYALMRECYLQPCINTFIIMKLSSSTKSSRT